MTDRERILITGGAGLAGMNAARAFAAAGIPVVMTVRKSSDRLEKALEEFRDQIVIEVINQSRSSEVFDLFCRYKFSGVIHTAQAHMHAQTPRREPCKLRYALQFP